MGFEGYLDMCVEIGQMEKVEMMSGQKKRKSPAVGSALAEAQVSSGSAEKSKNLLQHLHLSLQQRASLSVLGF